MLGLVEKAPDEAEAALSAEQGLQDQEGPSGTGEQHQRPGPIVRDHTVTRKEKGRPTGRPCCYFWMPSFAAISSGEHIIGRSSVSPIRALQDTLHILYC